MSDSIQRTSVGDFPISQTVTVPASASLIFISGTLPDLHNASAPAGTPAAYGNTEVQTVSVFNKLRTILRRQDLDLGDIVQLRVFLVGADETGGKLDFAGLQAGYTQFFDKVALCRYLFLALRELFILSGQFLTLDD